MTEMDPALWPQLHVHGVQLLEWIEDEAQLT